MGAGGVARHGRIRPLVQVFAADLVGRRLDAEGPIELTREAENHDVPLAPGLGRRERRDRRPGGEQERRDAHGRGRRLDLEVP